VWVAEDGETVIHNDGRCELLASIGTAGHEKLSDVMTHDADEVRRFHNALQRSCSNPVLFHSVCSVGTGELYTVDLFIVSQAQMYNTKEMHGAECSQGFLVGVCLRHQLVCHPIQCPLDTIEDVEEINHESESLSHHPVSEEAQTASCLDEEGSGSETPTTTTTGKVFRCSEDSKDMAESMAEIVKLGRKEHWLVEAHQLHVVPSCVLGQGSFAMVVEGYFHGKAVAVKMPSSQRTGRSIKSLIHEVRILRRIRHPGIVLFHGVCIADRRKRIGLVFEKVHGTSLRSFIKCQSPCPDKKDLYPLAVDVCEALRYLHGQDPQIIHGDLKGENIMVDTSTYARPFAKMLDFGLSQLVTRNATGLGGTLPWMAPEVITGSHPHTSADVFSFGHLLSFIMSGQCPCTGMSAQDITEMAKRGETCITVPSGSCFQEECEHLCKLCCVFEPAKRPNMMDVHERLLTWAFKEDLAEVGLACPGYLEIAQNYVKPTAATRGLVLPL